MRALATHRTLGPPAKRTASLQPETDAAVESEVWVLDTAHTVVAARWRGGALWIGGDRVLRIGADGPEALAPADRAPPELAFVGARGWSEVVPAAGDRYLALAGAATPPTRWIDDPSALLEAALAIPSTPASSPGLFARLLGKRPAPVDASALVLDVVDAPEPADLPAWLAALRARGVDLSWYGNEGGEGLVHGFRRPLGGEASVEAALLAHAREDRELTALVREHAEVWLDANGGESPEAGRLVADDPAAGWVESLELAAIAEGVHGGAGTWLDGGTGDARRASVYTLPGPAILAALQRTVERPAIVAVHSAPEEAVLAIHLIGGIDRGSGDLVGFALQRIWT